MAFRTSSTRTSATLHRGASCALPGNLYGKGSRSPSVRRSFRSSFLLFLLLPQADHEHEKKGSWCMAEKMSVRIKERR